MNARAVTAVGPGKERGKELALETPPLVAHVHVPQQRNVPLRIDGDGQIAERRPVAEQHVKVRLRTRQQKRQIARQRRIRRQRPRRDRQPRTAQREEPVAQRQQRKQDTECRRHPVGRPAGIRPGKIARPERKRHRQRFVILERGVEIAEQDGPLPRGSHIVLNDVAIIAAGKARHGLDVLRHRHREGEMLDRIVPLRAQQRQVQRLLAVRLSHKAGERIGDGERPAPGESGVVLQLEQRIPVLDDFLRAIARDGRALRIRAKRDGQALFNAGELDRHRLRHLARSVARDETVRPQIGDRPGGGRPGRQRQQQKQQQQKTFDNTHPIENSAIMDKIPQSRAKCNSPRRIRWKNPPIPPQMRAIFRAAARFFASRLENAERIWYNTLLMKSKQEVMP